MEQQRKEQPNISSPLNRWSEAATFQFIEMYQSHPCLWCRYDKDYKNLATRRKAYADIKEKLPHMSISDVKNKIKNLRSTYHQEVKKRNRWAAKNIKYKTKLKWFQVFGHLMENTEQDPLEDFEKGKSTDSDSSDEYLVEIKEEQPDNNDESVEKNNYLQLAQEQQITPEIAAIDEFQMFSNNIAEQLRQLPLDRALRLQVEIQTLLARERIKLFNESTQRPA